MELELRDYLRVLKKRRLIVIVALLTCLGGAAAATAMSTPVYSAKARLFVGPVQVSSAEISEALAVRQLSERLHQSYVEMVKSRSIAERAVEDGNLPVTPRSLAGTIRASAVLNTSIIDISYRSADPALAQSVVNAVSIAFVDRIESLHTGDTLGAEPAVNVSIVDPALLPESPVAPQPMRNMALALVLGAMLGVGLAFLFEYLDTTLRTPEEAEDAAAVPVLAVVPKVEGTSREPLLAKDSQSVAAESFRKLRTAVQFSSVDAPIRVILVTSPMAADGKTTTALNLATAYAQAGLRTVLLEGDLRRPSVHTLFPTSGQTGLTTALIGRVSIEESVLPTPIRNLSYVPAGALPPNPAELLASQQMGDLVDRLRAMSDLVIIDAPPILPVADAAVLAPRADGVVMVARSGSTQRDHLAEAAKIVQQSGTRLIGLLLNCVSRKDGSDRFYGYYSGYRSVGSRPAFEMSGDAAPAKFGDERVEPARAPRARQRSS